MLCRDVMLPYVYKCYETDSVHLCARKMLEENVGFLPVVDNHEKLVGVITDRDLTIRVLAANRPPSTEVAAVMSTRELLTCKPEDNLKHVEERMVEAKKLRVPVLDDLGTCIGIISLSDIAQSERSWRTAHLLREISWRAAEAPIER
jgi:CBS domain-containing protein